MHRQPKSSGIAESFIRYLQTLTVSDRGALAELKRSLGFTPGAYPPAFPYIERFVGADRHASDPYRLALYVTAGLFALHPAHAAGRTFAAAFGALQVERNSPSIEKRFITLLSADAEDLSQYLRQAVTLLATGGGGLCYVQLLQDLSRWLNPLAVEARDALRQRWARDFYRALEADTHSST